MLEKKRSVPFSSALLAKGDREEHDRSTERTDGDPRNERSATDLDATDRTGWGNNSTRERALLPTCLMLDKKLSWANRKIPRAPQPRLESGKNRSLLPIRRFRLAGCFHCSSFIAPVSPRRSQISRIRDNSTSLVESQLTTLRSCRSSRSLYYITLPSIHRRVFFTQQYIISVLFHGLILVYRNIYLPNQPVHILFISKERKEEKEWYLASPDSFRFSWWNPIYSKPSPFFQEQLIPRSFFSFSHLAESRASLLSF